MRTFVMEAMLLKTRHFFTLTVAIFTFAFTGSAQIGGNSVYKFLDIPVTARQSALGGKMVPIKDNDFNTILSNPSLLNQAMNNHLGFSYVNYIGDLNYFYTGYSRHYDKLGSFAMSLQAMNYGKFNSADETGLITGQFKAGDYCYNIQYARQLDTNFSIGGTLKTIYSQLEQYTSFGSALDIGATYHLPKQSFTLSALIKNVGYQWKPYTSGDKEPLPFDMQIGLSKKLAKSPLRFVLVVHHLQKWDLTYMDVNNPEPTTDPLTGEPIEPKKLKKFGDKLGRHLIGGVELVLGKNFNIQFSYNYQRRKELKFDTHAGIAGLSFGAGFKVSKFNISYSHSQFNAAGASDHITIATNLSSFYSKQ